MVWEFEIDLVGDGGAPRRIVVKPGDARLGRGRLGEGEACAPPPARHH